MHLQDMKTKVSQVIHQVQELIDNTEEIYSTIHLKLPSIERDISLTIDEMSILLEFFIPSELSREESLEKGASNELNRLTCVLNQIEDNFSKTAQDLLDEGEVRRVIDLFLNEEQSEETGISNLLEMIEQIKDRLTDIQIVSTNAIIYAAHLGTEGKAFGVVSDNINILSNQINQQYAEIQEYAQKIEEWNNQFKENIQDTLKYHGQLTSEKREEFEKLFSFTFESLQKVSFLLKDLGSNMESAVSPVEELMVSIQVQDIVRQNMENLNKCLNTLLENIDNHQKKGLEGDRQMLNFFHFSSGALGLSVKLASNVEKELVNSFHDLRGPLQEIQEKTAEINEEGSILTEVLGGDPGGDPGGQEGSVKEIFLQLQSFIDDFSQDISNLQEVISNFSHSNQDFFIQITNIEKRIQEIKKRINFLQKLQLMTRIELARLHLENDFFAREISSISEQVIKDVYTNEALIVSLKNKLMKDLNHFDQLLTLNLKQVGDMLEVIDTSRDEMNNIEELVTSAIQSMGQSCNNLTEAVQGIGHNLELGEQLPGTLHEIAGLLQELHQEVMEEKDKVLESAGLDRWEETSQELEEVLGNLTTYLERVAAHEALTGIEVDTGDDSGDLTLF